MNCKKQGVDSVFRRLEPVAIFHVTYDVTFAGLFWHGRRRKKNCRKNKIR